MPGSANFLSSVAASKALIPAATLTDLLRAALTAHGQAPLLWEDGGHALLVHPGRARTHCGAGHLLVELPVTCDEHGETKVIVTIGLPSIPAIGPVVVLERPPRGRRTVVARWGDALLALTWTAVHNLADAWARGAAPGATEVAAGIAVTAAGLHIVAAPPPAAPWTADLDPVRLAAVDLSALGLPRFSQGG